MATKSLLSRDITSLQQEIFRDLESQYKQPDLERGLERDIIQTTTAIVHQTRLSSAAPESIPELPSTVPESQFLSNVDTQLHVVPRAPKSDKQIALGQKMMSQTSDGATQELTPSHYDDIISKSRSAHQLQENDQEQDLQQEWDRESDEEEETAVTQHEGEPGFIDLLSFDSPREETHEQDTESQQRPPDEEVQLQNLEDSEPIEVDFSPTQPQDALSLSPDSQRFKTPATAGKKRRYNGEVLNSPELPRNPAPLLRSGKNNASAMGMSQMFAATQANTSPFLPRFNGDLHSDRPSPNINLQARPVTADSSSPMRAISSIRRSERAGTEPLDLYVSSKDSQVRREEKQRREKEEMARSLYSDYDEDFAILDDSLDLHYRRERERNSRIQPLLASSSPFVSSAKGRVALSRSSPIRGPRRSPIRNTGLGRRPRSSPKSSPRSSPSRPPPQSQITESEEDTEQEDVDIIIMPGSSQPAVPLDEEDKENVSVQAIQVPQTTDFRLQRVVNELPTQVQASPLFRHGKSTIDNLAPRALYSSQPFAVADSQPERAAKRSLTVTQVPRSSTVEEGLDFVPQSPESSPRPTALIDREDASASSPVVEVLEVAEHPTTTSIDINEPASNSETRQVLDSTIPETSPEEPQVLSGKSSHGKPESDEAESRGEFETAQSHLQPSVGSAHQTGGVDMSPGNLRTPMTPPVKKRKRISDIQAEPSPMKAQTSFDASAALHLESNFFEPTQGSPTPKRTRRATAMEVEIRDAITENALSEVAALQPQDDAAARKAHPEEEETIVHQVTQPLNKLSMSPPSTRPKRDRMPTAKVLSARKGRFSSTMPATRTSQFDLPESPPKKALFVRKPASRLKRKAEVIIEPSEEASDMHSKRQKVLEEKEPTPESVGDTEKRQESPSPPSLPQSAPLNESAESDHATDTLESANSTVVAPNMVFAAYKGNRYYPAICLGESDAEPGRLKIRWPGFDPDVVDDVRVRSLDLRVGDQVKIDLEGFPKVSHVIRGLKDKVEVEIPDPSQAMTDIRGYRTLLVATKQRNSLPADVSLDAVKPVPISAIYLDTKMWNHMKDRPYKYNALPSPGVATPVSRSSTPGTPSTRSRRGTMAALPPTSSAIDLTEGAFANMAFAVSYADSDRKDALTKLIHENGGIILAEDFLDLFEPDSVQLRDQYVDLNFTALITDRHSRRPKYLQALALGLPCLSGKWVEASVKTGRCVDWTSYLLAAGESMELEGATRSRILPYSSRMKSSSVVDMIASRDEPLTDARVVVVMGKRKAAEKRQPYLSLIRALGPRQIDTEQDLNSAKAIIESAAQSAEPVDYIFVDDREVEAASETFFPTNSANTTNEPKGRKVSKSKKGRASTQPEPDTKKEDEDSAARKVKVMCNEDIVQSLILGRLWIGL